MSDYIPFEIQVEIIKWFPVKSLLQFRKVSKTWKSLIDSEQFINDYTDQNRNTQRQQQHLLMRYIDLPDYKHKCFSIIDNDTFPQHKHSLIVPQSVNLLDDNQIYVRVVGSSNGLFCFFPCTPIKKVVIWNPSIRKSVAVTVPHRDEYSFVGFGVCPNTNDLKIVKIYGPQFTGNLEELSCCHWRVDVFTLSSGTWRSPLGNLPSKRLHIFCTNRHVAVDRFIYWYGRKRIYNMDDNFSMIGMSFSFDMTSEDFMPIYLPDKLACHYYLPMFKLRESLGLIECKVNVYDEQVYKVWVMENGVSNSFKKLYTVNLPFDTRRQVVGLRKNDELLMESRVDDEEEEDEDDDEVERAQLVVYEPSSKQINNLGIYGEAGSFFMSSYTESLLLLNQPNTIIGGHVEGNGD